MSPFTKPVKMIKFNNGQQYPILGLGTWQVRYYTIIHDMSHVVLYQLLLPEQSKNVTQSFKKLQVIKCMRFKFVIN